VHRSAITCLFAAAFLVACESSRLEALPKIEYVVTYYDRNHDGQVDFEWHHAINASDSDWALIDTNSDGFYDARLEYGYGFDHKRIHKAVPQYVHLQTESLPEGLLPPSDIHL